MESNPRDQVPDQPDDSADPVDARAALAVADAAGRRMAAGLRLPAGTLPVLGAAVAVQVATAATGIAAQTTTGLAVVLGGLGVFLGAAALVLHRFRRANGVRVDGLASQVLLASGALASLVYPGAFAAATWAAFASQWWLVAVAAVVAGIGCAFGLRRWWRTYRHEPSEHASGASPRVLAGLAVVAVLGFATLLAFG